MLNYNFIKQQHTGFEESKPPVALFSKSVIHNM